MLDMCLLKVYKNSLVTQNMAALLKANLIVRAHLKEEGVFHVHVEPFKQHLEYYFGLIFGAKSIDL